jgi:hypothetical protein
MRVLILTLIVISCCTVISFGQTTPCEEGRTVSTNEKGDSIIGYAEKLPFLKEGFEPYLKWIKTNMDKKLMSKKKDQRKKVYVGFVVHEDGRTSDYKIDKGLGPPYDNEALRLVRDNPQEWVAGGCGKRKVKTRMTMPVEF